jgi:hypothetical protein
MIETILLSIAAAKLRGYRIKLLFMSWEIYPVLAFELMYIILEFTIFKGNYNFIKYTSIFKTLYIAVFLILVIRYNQYVSALIGSVFIIAGSLLNNLAISSNNGKMPVFPTLSYLTGYIKPGVFSKVNDIHALGNSLTKYKLLTDIVDVGYSIMSIGDIFIRVFAFIIIFNTIKYINKKEFGSSSHNVLN